MPSDTQFYILLSLIAVVFILLIVIALKVFSKKDNTEGLIRKISENSSKDAQALRQEVSQNVQQSVKNLGDILSLNQQNAAASQNEKMIGFEERFKTFSLENEQKLDIIRTTVEKRLAYMQEDNNRKLDEMRKTVDEKLQKTLEDKMTQSFALVNERLEQVYKGLGEMRTLAVGVGDLKKVLSNVKTRGILGEIQLGSILKEILAPEQYEENVATKPRSTERVEFAVKLPAEDEGFVYLPIDSKFPGDTYLALQDAYESGSKEAVDAAAKVLLTTLKKEAKDIRDKYIDPPSTTEFAVMFLPTEGLYAEAVNRGMVEVLQREYKVNIAGPSTMAALLNSLQMGFKTLAVQKRSAEVWKILGSVKTEFEKFNDVLMLTQQRLDQANSELDKLVGVRTRQICRKLSSVEANTTPLESFSVGALPEETE
ncbi:MAG: DNA recombination protein RmuC [Ruminococcaceae bacterium]|nr:DNA recombination protein RmuC [Oscillospiraceae bacterium]